MKTIHIIIVVFLVISAALLPQFTANSFASAKSPEKTAGFKGSPAWNKLDLRMRQAWEDSGFRARSVIGRIVTGSVDVGDLPQVANLKFISAMELAVPMMLK